MRTIRKKAFMEESDLEFYQRTNRTTGMEELILSDENQGVLSKITFSLSPITTYTARRNPDEFLLIEWMTTPEEYRGKGYASMTLKELTRRYPNKTFIATPNSHSRGLLKRFGVTFERE